MDILLFFFLDFVCLGGGGVCGAGSIVEFLVSSLVGFVGYDFYWREVVV